MDTTNTARPASAGTRTSSSVVRVQADAIALAVLEVREVTMASGGGARHQHLAAGIFDALERRVDVGLRAEIHARTEVRGFVLGSLEQAALVTQQRGFL